MPLLREIRVRAAAALIGVLAMSVCLPSCTPRGRVPAKAPHKVADIKTILVMEFDVPSERNEAGGSVRCAVCGAVFTSGGTDWGATDYMTEQLLTFLKAGTAYELIPPGPGEGVRSQILSESVGLSERDLLVEIGRRLRVDAVVKGTVYRFRQRVGTRFSVDTPASVAFDIHMIRVADGRLIWQGKSDVTQQSLSEDLLKLGSFIRGGGGWLTAEELGRSELNRVMAGLPAP